MAKKIYCFSKLLRRFSFIGHIAEDSFGCSALGQQDFFSSGVLVWVRAPDDDAGAGFRTGFRHAEADARQLQLLERGPRRRG